LGTTDPEEPKINFHAEKRTGEDECLGLNTQKTNKPKMLGF
jgi:hypothetical protein